jgi:ribonucleoside-diphosphate reductase alpha chain
MGKKFLDADTQQELGIMSPEVKARIAQAQELLENGGSAGDDAPLSTPSPGQSALFNAWEDAVECAKCGGRMVRTGSCYTCRDCGQNTGCS